MYNSCTYTYIVLKLFAFSHWYNANMYVYTCHVCFILGGPTSSGGGTSDFADFTGFSSMSSGPPPAAGGGNPSFATFPPSSMVNPPSQPSAAVPFNADFGSFSQSPQLSKPQV